MTAYIPAEVFAPGDFLRDELDERGWTVTEFAQIIGRPVQAVSEILNGKKEITTETAFEIGAALGTSAEVWLNLQTQFRLYEQRKRTGGALTDVERRGQLRSAVPYVEMRNRGWLPDTDDLGELEAATCRLLGVQTLAEDPAFAMAARRSDSALPVTPAQKAWLGRVRQLAATRSVADLDLSLLAATAEALPQRLSDGPDRLAEVPVLLAACGVVVVFLEGLRGGKLDGAVTFLDSGVPVIGLTTRGDRFDGLLFTLLHECAHLVLQHISAGTGLIIDDDVRDAGDDPLEIEANLQAEQWEFPDGFTCQSVGIAGIAEAASRYSVHPSVVIGRIQYKTGNWPKHRKYIPKVRPALAEAGLLS